jgi:LacI family transcriptional regulator
MHQASGKKHTMADVARAAGVSKSTVSRAFAQPDLLGRETVERIVGIADQLGYVPNHTARALSTGRHSNLALIVSDVANPFFPPLIRAAQMQADRSDFCVFLGHSDEDHRQEDKLITRFETQVEGVLLVASRLTAERIKFHARRRPLALVNRDVVGIPRVLIDSSTGVRQAINHLFELGHTKIAYVSGPHSSWANRQRRNAVNSAARQHGMTVEIVNAQVPSHESGRAVVPDLLRSQATAAVAFDDLTAQGIMTGMAERGIQLPSQFSLVGCDDVLGAATYPALTTVSNRSDEAGRAGVRLLLDMLEGRMAGDTRLVLDTHLVIRQTTAAPKVRT